MTDKYNLRKLEEDRIRQSETASDSAGQNNVLPHQGASFRVERAQVGILKQPDHRSFRGLLQSGKGACLETGHSFFLITDWGIDVEVTQGFPN